MENYLHEVNSLYVYEQSRLKIKMALTHEKMKRSRICNRFMVYFIQDIRFYFSQNLFSKVFFCVKNIGLAKSIEIKLF